MPFLTQVKIENHFKAPDAVIDLADAGLARGWRHLILTGPNGAGKTTVLDALAAQLDENLSGSGNLRTWMVQPCWNEALPRLKKGVRSGQLIVAVLQAGRQLKMSPVRGPVNFEIPLRPSKGSVSAYLAQHLTNLNINARLAKEDDPAASATMFGWLVQFDETLAMLFESPGLKLKFSYNPYELLFVESGCEPYGFEHLAAGHSAILTIFAELLMRTDGTARALNRTDEGLSGVVLIDEPELHLHPSLQEKVLPFLTQLFPRFQFIVATHSSPVISSIDGALVVDLASGVQVPSESLRGVPYGRLMTSHFGIATDIDLQSTEKLLKLQALDEKIRTAEEERAYLLLARELSTTAHPLALDIWTRILGAQRSHAS